MGKRRVARPAAKDGQDPPTSDPALSHSVMTALSDARAAWYLADAIEHEYVAVCYAGLGDRASNVKRREEIRGRLFHRALEQIEEALTEAETALRDSLTPKAVA